jgi:hypothetical protein
MKRAIREGKEVIQLPIVDVNFVLLAFKSPRMTTLLNGARRLAVEKVVQMLETAKRNQIDGQVQLDCKDIGLLLQAMALSVESIVEIIHGWFEDDEQT